MPLFVNTNFYSGLFFLKSTNHNPQKENHTRTGDDMKIWKSAVVGYIGGIVYVGMELLWRGWSHGSMFVVGGLCFLLLGEIHRKLFYLPRLVQAVLGALSITAMELLSVLFVNVFLGLLVWDYSNLPYNFLGQVCMAYFFLWIWVAMAGEVLEPGLRRGLFSRFSEQALTD